MSLMLFSCVPSPPCSLRALHSGAKSQDFSLSFLIYLVITFLVHLYSSTGLNATASTGGADGSPHDAEQAGYSKLPSSARTNGHARSRPSDEDGAEAYELTEQDDDEDATKIGGEDEVDWIDRASGHSSSGGAVRI